MRKLSILLSVQLFIFLGVGLRAQEVLGEGFHRVWSDSVQTAIDQNIERYRKADASVVLEKVRPGTKVKVEQISHEFLFGSNIFLFGQLDTPDAYFPPGNVHGHSSGCR